MALFTRVLRSKARGLPRRIQTDAAAAADAFAVRLLREPEYGVKETLDSKESAALRDGGESFWEHLVVRLGDFSSRKALLVLEWKLEKLLKEDIRVYDPYLKLIQLASNLNSISFAMRVFSSVESHGILPNTSIYNALLSAFLSIGSLPTALSLFEIMQWSENAKPDLSTYTFFVSFHSSLGDEHSMEVWYSAVKKSGFHPDVNMHEVLITGFIRSGKIKECYPIFDELLRSEASLNSQILDSMLEGFCIERDTKRVAELVEYAAKSGLKLSRFSVEKLIRVHLEQGECEELAALLEMLAPSIDLGTDSGICGSFIRVYAIQDKVEEMENWIGRMMDAGLMFTRKEDVEAVISSYFRQKAFGRLDLFLARIKSSYEFAKSTYDILVAGCRKFGLYERLDSVVREMKGGHYESNRV